MQFRSDNYGPAHPEVMQAVMDANQGYDVSYGDDAPMQQVRAQIREIFEAPEAAVYLVATGTAANALALATLARPWQSLFCTPEAHIATDECNAPEFYSGGAKLTLVGAGDKMDAETLRAVIAPFEARGVHGAQRGPVSLTQTTELGRCYTQAEVAAIADVAHDFGQPLYMDGARLANAIAALGCSPADLTHRAGVDALSLGGTKNGCLGVEAVVFFNPARAWEFELRRKRGGHLFSKNRFLAAQMQAYLSDGLWLRSAAAANANCARLAEGLRPVPGVTFLHEPDANALFVRMPRAMHRRLRAAGGHYYLWDAEEADLAREGGPVLARMVCDWSLPVAEIDRFVALAAA
ncbi:beta-eliminating lyase-related protein [Pseudooceanicola sp.]|uniref:threonine aldolase family protein n=1 Tax=Pseudooceanicola sp. TaxID=1914328 RepID=UPI00262320D3|nr:beta-eliminating lyase-related protein [Pseudooceanicola sp.]MDF1854458.1 beta-eliminating lyase-related protein [Pseudooceanicola sp.]